MRLGLFGVGFVGVFFLWGVGKEGMEWEGW